MSTLPQLFLMLVVTLSVTLLPATAAGATASSGQTSIESGAGGGWGRTFYVDYASGNDVNTGTYQSAPFKHCPGDSAFAGSISLQTGDTVNFKQGVIYYGMIVTQAPGVTYTISSGWGTGDAVIDGSAQDAALIVHHDKTKVDGGAGRNLVFTGAIRHALIWHFGEKPVNGCFYGRLKIRDIPATNVEGIGIKIGGNSVAYLDNEIAYNEITRAYSAGIKISGSGTSNILIHDNVLEGNGLQTGERTQMNISSNAGAGVQNTKIYNNVIKNGCAAKDCNGININNANHEVYNNEIYGHQGSGLALNPGYNKSYAGVLRIHGNKIHDQGKYGLILVDTDSSRYAVIYNNVFYHNALYDINLAGGSTHNNHIYNNTLYNSARGLWIQGGNGNIIKNNIIWPSGYFPIVDDSGASTIDTNLFANNATSRGTNALAGDPLFVDAAGADFRLQAGSPCIDRGSDLSAYFTIDLAGSTRPVGPAWDIGAYEYDPDNNAIRTVSQ